MSDKITVTSRNSYGSRVKNSFAKIGLGFLLVIGSIIGIFWNEKNFLETKVALNEGAEIVKEAVSTEINPELDQAEVHLHGELSSPAEALKDPIFGVTVDDLKLTRKVSMYQWIEDSEEHCTDNIGGSETCETTYSYTKTREDDPIDSSNFYETAGHNNPVTWKYEADEREKSPILVGKYTLDDVFVEQLTNYKTVDLSTQEIIIPEEYKIANETMSPTENTAENVEDNIEENNNSYLYGDQEPGNATEEVSEGGLFHVNNGYIYIGKNESNPEVGDLKITFSSVKPGTVSVIGQQDGESLRSYIVSNGRPIALLSQGNVSAEQMFISAQKANKAMTRLLRLILLLLMFGGFSMIFEFITTLAKVLPFLSRIIGVGTGVIAFALTLVFGFLAIGISRLAVRPVVGISCLVVVVAGIVMLVRARKNKKSNTGDPKMENGNDKDIEVIEA